MTMEEKILEVDPFIINGTAYIPDLVFKRSVFEIFDYFEQQLKELNDYYLKQQDKDAENIVSKGLKIYELKNKLKEKDCEGTVSYLNSCIEERDKRIAELETLCDKAVSDVIAEHSNYKVLEAKLKRYENPVAEFNGTMEAHGDEVPHIVDETTGFVLADTYENHQNKKYHVIVLEGGE